MQVLAISPVKLLTLTPFAAVMSLYRRAAVAAITNKEKPIPSHVAAQWRMQIDKADDKRKNTHRNTRP